MPGPGSRRGWVGEKVEGGRDRGFRRGNQEMGMGALGRKGRRDRIEDFQRLKLG